MSREQHQESLFRALVEGEVAETSPEVRALFAGRPDLVEAWREIRGVFDAVGRATRTREAVLAAAERVDAVPGGARAESILRAEIAKARGSNRLAVVATEPVVSLPERPKRSVSLAWPVALAAGLLVAIFLIAREATVPDAGPGNEPIQLGSGDLELVPLAATDRASLRFEWKGALPPGSKSHIYLEGRSDPSMEWTQCYDREVSGTSWSPRRELTASWPKHLRWKVKAFMSDDSYVGESPWSEVELSH